MCNLGVFDALSDKELPHLLSDVEAINLTSILTVAPLITKPEELGILVIGDMIKKARHLSCRLQIVVLTPRIDVHQFGLEFPHALYIFFHMQQINFVHSV